MRQFRIVGVGLQNRQIMTGITVTVPDDIPLTIANGNNASGIEANPAAVAYVVTAVTTEMIRYAASECLKAYNQS